MKLPPTLVAILLYATLVQCTSKQTSRAASNYPKEIDSLAIQDLYDTARIYLYTWFCDHKVDGKYYRGQFRLEFQSFLERNDTIELFFRHYLPKEKQDTGARSEYAHRTSVAFDRKSKEKLWAFDINGFSKGLVPGDARFENCATPEVVSFIKANRSILDSGFVDLAIKTRLLPAR